jgi:hypothetical protein
MLAETGDVKMTMIERSTEAESWGDEDIAS